MDSVNTPPPQQLGHAAETPPKRARARYALAVLFLVGVFNLTDRQILAILLEPIRNDLGLSDSAMGVLTGYAFVLFYTLASLPIARLADMYTRRTIIAAGLAFWSVMTSLSGLASSFWQLGLARIGVGVGESAYFSPGLSMISDYFPSARRTLALSVIAVSTQVGIMASLLLGGWLGETVGWRMTLVWLGVPGLLLALLMRLTVREPERGGAEAGRVDVTLYDVRTTLAYLWNQRAFRHLAAGATLSLFALSSLAVWSPAFLMRLHGMELMEAAAWLGLPTGIGGAAGVLLGGLIAQRLSQRDGRWLMWVPALILFLSMPLVVLFLLLPTRSAAVSMYVGAALFLPAWR